MCVLESYPNIGHDGYTAVLYFSRHQDKGKECKHAHGHSGSDPRMVVVIHGYADTDFGHGHEPDTNMTIGGGVLQ